MSDTSHYLEKELEHYLQSDPEIWRFIREGSLDGIWFWDLENPEHEYMSPEFWRVFGFDPETKEHLAAEWQDLIFPEDLELAKKNVAAHMADPNHPYDQIVRYKCADGRVATVRCRGLAVRNKDGKAIRLLGTHQDITAQQREMADTRDELEILFNTVTNGIVAFDEHGVIVRCNNHARHLLGGVSTPTPFAWPDNIKFLDAETLRPVVDDQDPVPRALSGDPIANQVHVMQRSGSEHNPRYVRLRSAPSQTEGGIHTVLIIDDVTDDERNRQVIERKGRLDALGQLTGGIAHDFNNLLTSLLYSVVLAERAESAEERKENLDEAVASIERARALTGRLMAFGRKQPGTATSASIEQVFEDFRALIRPILEEKIVFEVDVSVPGLFIYCDLAQLESAIMNLVLNSRDAILASGEGDKITLRARAVDSRSMEAGDASASQGRFVEISLTDNGPGMDAETRTRATDPFFTTKDFHVGTGLGLPTVYAFAIQSNGSFKIYSEPGLGTTVQLTLPRGTKAGPKEEPMPRDDIMPGGGQTILLVEDDVKILQMTSKLLSHLGYELITATSGREALDMTEAGAEYDLLLTDVVMPGPIGGFELAKRVLALRPEVGVIYVSGYTGFSNEEMGEVRAPLLQKPAPPTELADAIRSVFEK